MKPLLALDTETRGLYGELLGFGIGGYDGSLDDYDASAHNKEDLKSPYTKRFIQEELFNKHVVLMHNAKYDLEIMEREGFTIPEYIDTMVLAHILNPLMPCGLDEVGYRYTGERKIHVENKANLEWTDKVIDYCLQDVKLTYDAGVAMLKELYECESHKEWFFKHEMPYVEVIREMERIGLIVDRNRTIEAYNEIGDIMATALAEVQSLTPLMPGKEVNYKRKTPDGFGFFVRNGDIQWEHCLLEPFSPSSGAHIARLLSSYGWEPEKFTPSGAPSTEADVLEELDYPILKPILRYKEVQTIHGTFLKALLNADPIIGEYAVLRGSFNQAVTITGRLSSSSPNLQNLAARGEFGKLVRSLVVAPPGFEIVDIDLCY